MPTSPYDPFAPKRIPPPTNLGVPQDRTPYTGIFGETPQAPASPGLNAGQSFGGASPTSGTQLGAQNGISGYMGPAPAYAGDAPGSNSDSLVNANAHIAAGEGTGYTPGYNPISTLGGSPSLPFGDPARAAAQQLQLQAYGASQRQGPQIDTGATNMFAGGVGNALGQANGTNLLGVRQGLDLSSLANGPGVAAQYGAANKLMGMANMPAGPSVAEQQLRMGGDQAMRQQMAMAAGARGGNAGLALQNAGQNQGDIMGNLNGQLGLQRASEDMANRQFAANAAQGAGNMYGQAIGSQANALGGAANIFGGIAGNQVNQANTNLGLTNTYAGLAGDQAKLGAMQNALNDQTMLSSQGMGNQLLENQRNAEMNQFQTEQGLANQRYATDKGVNLQSQLGNRQMDQADTASTMGGIGTAAATLLPLLMMSDVRAKKNIKPAGEEISNAFRTADQSAAQLMGTPVTYPQATASFPDVPGYAYQYKDPNAPGREPGQQFGPMAQDLEKTPAGASVVHEVNGKKAIDPGRLSLLNASETSKQRQELDAIKAKLFGEASGQQFAPNSGITGQRVMYHNGKPVMTGTDANGNPVVLDDRPIGASFAGYGVPPEMQGYQPQHGPVAQGGAMAVMGVGPNGRPLIGRRQLPSSGPSIGFGPGDMGYGTGM